MRKKYFYLFILPLMFWPFFSCASSENMIETTTQTTQTAKRRGKGKSGYDATRDGENTRLQQDAARGKGAWDCEKYEEIRPEDEAKVFEEIATANEGDFLFEGERCCS